jgi:hypothetical protein
MMGWRTRLKGGDEHDALTGWRRFLGWRPGQRKQAKQSHNRRIRREARVNLAMEKKNGTRGEG